MVNSIQTTVSKFGWFLRLAWFFHSVFVQILLINFNEFISFTSLNKISVFYVMVEKLVTKINLCKVVRSFRAEIRPQSEKLLNPNTFCQNVVILVPEIRENHFRIAVKVVIHDVMIFVVLCREISILNDPLENIPLDPFRYVIQRQKTSVIFFFQKFIVQNLLLLFIIFIHYFVRKYNSRSVVIDSHFLNEFLSFFVVASHCVSHKHSLEFVTNTKTSVQKRLQ